MLALPRLVRDKEEEAEKEDWWRRRWSKGTRKSAEDKQKRRHTGPKRMRQRPE